MREAQQQLAKQSATIVVSSHIACVHSCSQPPVRLGSTTRPSGRWYAKDAGATTCRKVIVGTTPRWFSCCSITMYKRTGSPAHTELCRHTNTAGTCTQHICPGSLRSCGHSCTRGTDQLQRHNKDCVLHIYTQHPIVLAMLLLRPRTPCQAYKMILQ
jgi:hypothetical protein